MGDAGDSFWVPNAFHYIQVESTVGNHIFMGFDGYDPYENPIYVEVTSDTTVTAVYMDCG